MLGAKDAKMIKTWSIFLGLSQSIGWRSTKSYEDSGQRWICTGERFIPHHIWEDRGGSGENEEKSSDEEKSDPEA